MVPEKKHKKSKSKDKEKKKQQDKKSYSSISQDELFDDEADTDEDESINLDEELHPIGYYVNDRQAMLDHVFSVTTEKKIRAMLPPVLKALSLSELKSLCLDQLLGMSTKRILSILEGQQLESSSDTDDVGVESDSEPKGQIAEEKNHSEDLADVDGFEMSGPDMDTLEIGITSKEMGDLFTDDAELKTEKAKEKSSAKKCKHVLKKKHKKHSDKKKRDKENKSSETSPGESKKAKPVQKESMEEDKGKSLLEILELEMRARAIRALLREQGDSPVRQSPVELLCEQETSSVKTNIKQEKPTEPKKLKKKDAEVASDDNYKSNKMDIHGCKKRRHSKNSFEARVKTEIIDVDSDSSLDVKEIVKVIHSDLETVSSGEEVFMDMKMKSDAAREDGEISSIDDGRVGGGGEEDDDDVIEVEYDASREVIVVEDSDCDVEEITEVTPAKDPAVTLSDTSDQTDRVVPTESLSPDREESTAEEHPTESWAQRWLKSKGVQKVVSDSKIVARIHKRMKTTHKVKTSERDRTAVSSVEVVGSVEEYKSLQLRKSK